MKKRISSFILAWMCLITALVGCSPKLTRYEASFLNLFDTVTTIIGYSESKDDFARTANDIHAKLNEYHKLFDIYNTYEGMNNLKTINDNAGIEPVKVDVKIIEMLVFCKDMYYKTNGTVNVCMGSVLSLWSEARKLGIKDPESAELPHREALLSSSEHTNIEDLIIDEENNTVFLRDPNMRLDVGAIAKGYAAEKVKDTLPEGYLLSLGGNVCSGGVQKGENEFWNVGLTNPHNSSEALYTLNITNESIVSSGDYQRYYMVDGVKYHHIISPDTLMPADRYSTVAIICEDSGIADALSTALYILSEEDGEKLLKQFGAEALWVYKDGTQKSSDGFFEYTK